MKTTKILILLFIIAMIPMLVIAYITRDRYAQKATIGTTDVSYIDRTVNPMYNQMYRDINWNESKNDPTAINPISGATGGLQYTQIRVDAINEMFGTDYILSDFLDEKLSYRVFIKVQLLRNPQADWEFGIRDWATPSNHYAALTSARMEVIKGRERK